MRKFLCLITALSLSSISFGVNDDDRFRRGDVNVDGILDNSDPIALGNYIFHGTFSPTCLDSCDANDDGLVDNSDIVYLLEYLHNSGAMPPAPFPGCGDDPTEDGLGCNLYDPYNPYYSCSTE